MLTIRLARTGKKKQAYFRVVVADSRCAVGAKFIEIVGNYDPHKKKLSVDSEKLDAYIKNGAQPSNTLAKLLVKEGFKLPKWVKIKEKVKKKKEKGKAEPKTQIEKTDKKEKFSTSEEKAEESKPSDKPAENADKNSKNESSREGKEKNDATQNSESVETSKEGAEDAPAKVEPEAKNKSN